MVYLCLKKLADVRISPDLDLPQKWHKLFIKLTLNDISGETHMWHYHQKSILQEIFEYF